MDGFLCQRYLISRWMGILMSSHKKGEWVSLSQLHFLSPRREETGVRGLEGIMSWWFIHRKHLSHYDIGMCVKNIKIIHYCSPLWRKFIISSFCSSFLSVSYSFIFTSTYFPSYCSSLFSNPRWTSSSAISLYFSRQMVVRVSSLS